MPEADDPFKVMREADPLAVMRQVAKDAEQHPGTRTAAPEYGLGETRRSWTGWPGRDRPNDAPAPTTP